MPNGTGIGILGDWITDFGDINIYVLWDITPDRRDERYLIHGLSYITRFDARNLTQRYVLKTYVSRWIWLYYDPEPISESNIYLHWCKEYNSSRNIYFYLDESIRYIYISGLLTSTPLLLKYPKYYNWEKLPRVLTPEFLIWSYYEIDESSIVIKVISSSGYNKTFSMSLTPDKIIVEKLANYTYNVKVLIDNIFENNEEVTIYISCFDKYGNYLKPGLW